MSLTANDRVRANKTFRSRGTTWVTREGETGRIRKIEGKFAIVDFDRGICPVKARLEDLEAE